MVNGSLLYTANPKKQALLKTWIKLFFFLETLPVSPPNVAFSKSPCNHLREAT